MECIYVFIYRASTDILQIGAFEGLQQLISYFHLRLQRITGYFLYKVFLLLALIADSLWWSATLHWSYREGRTRACMEGIT